MDLETRIKELQRKLAIQKAYLSIRIELDDESLSSLDAIDQVAIESSIRNFCVSQSEAVDSPEEKHESLFTPEEITALKMFAQAALSKGATGTSSNDVKANDTVTAGKAVLKEESVKVFDKAKPLMAILLTTESVPTDRRKLVNSNDLVTVVKYNDKEAVIRNKADYTFVVPIEDLELQQQ